MRLRACIILAAARALVSSPAAAQEPAWAPAPWTSGYHNGSFYVRSPDDVFRLYVQGRVHADYYDSFGPGLNGLPPGQSIPSGFTLRRARLELAGEFFELWQWQLGAELAPSTADNAAANTSSQACKVDPNTGALACSTRENAVDSPSAKPAPTDAFVNFAPSPWANVQVGQYYLPFTMENRISDNTTPFLERALVIRAIGAPLQRDLGAMFWGESPDRVLYYAAGVFNGDGPNRPNADGRYDFAGRVVVRPLDRVRTDALRWAQLGASVHLGSRDAKAVGYDVPSLTTSQGFAFWKPTYIDSGARLIHILPSAAQTAVAGDVYVPLGNFDFTGEFVYASYDTREAVDGYQISPFTERLGQLKGYGYYAQAGYWILGDHDVLGYPSYGRPIHVDLDRPQQPARHGVQLLVRFEQLALRYDGASRGGTKDARSPTGDVDVTSASLGMNYWATRHMRVGVNYGYYSLPKTSAVSELHEVSTRFGVQF